MQDVDSAGLEAMPLDLLLVLQRLRPRRATSSHGARGAVRASRIWTCGSVRCSARHGRAIPGRRVLCVTHEDVVWAFR